jgi:iron complex outermembrane receptor protein
MSFVTVISRSAVVVLLSLGAGIRPGIAAADLTTTSSFDIAPQQLPSALLRFSQLTGVQVTSPGHLIEGKQSPGAVGTFRAREALDKLLRDTTLAYDVIDENTVLITTPTHAATAGQESTERSDISVSGGSGTPESSGNDAASTDERGKRSWWQRMLLAEADSSASSGAAGSTPATAPNSETHDAAGGLNEVVVVGSRLAVPAKEQAQRVHVITREAIDKSGASSIAQVLNQLTEVSIQSTTAPQQASRAASSVQLRGLPNGTTLVLLNGRRVAPSPFQASSGAINLNTLPLSAVERIEVLPSGSSALYGGDALAGVVNIVMKKDYDGTEASVRYGGADGYGERQAELAFGKKFERGSISVIGSYASNSDLLGSERAITANTDYSYLGGRNTSVTYTNPGNVYALNGQNLPGLNAKVAAIPKGQDGTHLTIADFVAGAGNPNRDTGFYGQGSQRPPTRDRSVQVFGNFALNDRVELFTELMFSRYESEERDYQSYMSGATGLYKVAASNPFNPFGVDVGIDYSFAGSGRYCYCLQQDYFRPLVGAKGDVGRWHWEITASDTHGRDNTDEGPALGLSSQDVVRVNAALADPDPATALNPFADRTWTLDEIAPYGSTRRQRLTSTLQSYEGFIRGPLFAVGAGDVQLLVGAEADRSTLDYNYYLTSARGDRHNEAAYLELRVPLLSARTEGGGDRIAVTGAARYDQYSDFGNRVSPEVGIELRPLPSLLLRAAYSSAYKPPTLYQLYAPVNTYANRQVVDRKRGSELYGVTLLQGGNRELEPLTGHTTTAGLVFMPQSLPGLELQATHWQAKIANYATIISYQMMVDNEELFAGKITRAAPTAADIAAGLPGRVTQVQDTYVNFGTYDLAGADFSGSWALRTAFGKITPSLSASYTYKYDTSLIPAAPVADRVGKADSSGYAPRWKAVASLDWATALVDASLTGRWVGRYQDYSVSTLELGNFWMLDANVRFELGKAFASSNTWLAGSYASLGAVNLLNKLPVYSYYTGSGVGYDPTQYDIRGRFVYLETGVKF